MKKFIVAFGMGMAMTYLVLLVGLRLTYTQNIPAFVFAVDAVIMVALIIGSVGTLLETVRETREDEVAPLPEEIKVTNDRVEKAPEKGPEAMRRIYTNMASYIPSGVGMRYETLIDDGVTGVIEWVHVVTDKGREELGRIAMSGIAAYMRGEDGRLISIRISDYAWKEKEIRWEETGTTEEEAGKVNRVHEFPAGVGRKPQESL